MADAYAEETAEPLEAETSGSIFLDPEAIPNADSLKPGATLTFVGVGKDGRLEFSSADAPVEEESMMDEMKRAVSANPMGMKEEMKGQM